jgi:hypothetical protein
MVAAQVDVHQAGHHCVVGGVPIKMHALDERGRAISDADDRDAHFVVCHVIALLGCGYNLRDYGR